MEKLIVATIENYDGLPAEVVESLKRKMYIPGMPFCVKKIEPTPDGSYKVGINIEVLGDEVVFTLDAKNVRLYKEYDEDYKVFDPLTDPEFKLEKEKSEE